MIVPITLLLVTVTGLTISAILAFWWAGGDGQFQNLEQAALSVFDCDEMPEPSTPLSDE